MDGWKGQCHTTLHFAIVQGREVWYTIIEHCGEPLDLARTLKGVKSVFYIFVASILIPSFLVFGIAATINRYREKQRELFSKRIRGEDRELFDSIHQRIQPLLEKEGQCEKPVPPKTS